MGFLLVFELHLHQGYHALSPFTHYSIYYLLEWREIETFVTDQMARNLGSIENPTPFYIVAQRYTPSLLVKLLLKPDIKRYYRSYPITFVAKRPEVKREADRLGKRLQTTSVVFDPMGIKDYDRKDELKSEYGAWCAKKGYSKHGADWKDIEEHIKQQTVSRDHRLIDQSNGLVVFYPELKYFTEKDGNFISTPLVPFSSGVLDEMHYATQRGKEVLLIWTSKKDPGPFLPKIYTRHFRSVDELLKFASSLDATNNASKIIKRRKKKIASRKIILKRIRDRERNGRKKSKLGSS